MPQSAASLTDDPKLPRVLLIGDSHLHGGYTCPKCGHCSEARPTSIASRRNGGSTTKGLENLKAWLGDEKWDVIHFNWGLHDLKFGNDGKKQVPLDEYEKNLRELVKQLKATNAKLIWCATTPVPEGDCESRPQEQRRHRLQRHRQEDHGRERRRD